MMSSTARSLLPMVGSHRRFLGAAGEASNVLTMEGQVARSSTVGIRTFTDNCWKTRLDNPRLALRERQRDVHDASFTAGRHGKASVPA
jgi:hypothetical protein